MTMQSATLFYSYSHTDQALRSALDNHLALLKRQGLLSTWFDGEIAPGSEWRNEIERKLDDADIIMLLISSDFLASDFCWSVELDRAMYRHNSGSANVIPVIVRPCDWKKAPFGSLQALPDNGKAVTQWQNSDEAWLSVAQGLRSLLEKRPPRGAKTEPREKWVIQIEARLDALGAEDLNTIASFLKQLSGDSKLRIERISSGSVKLHIDISASGAAVLGKFVRSGALKALSGFTIESFTADHQLEPAKRFLFVNSIPITALPLSLDHEFNEIDRALRRSRSGSNFVMRQSYITTAAGLAGEIERYEPDVLHFSGHGSKDGGVYLQGIDGETQEVPADALRAMLSIASKPVKLVVLNACYSAQQASAIAEVADCVVGVESGISDQAAIDFASSFYDALGSGLSVGQSFLLANAALELRGTVQSGRPRLQSRTGADPYSITMARS